MAILDAKPINEPISEVDTVDVASFVAVFLGVSVLCGAAVVQYFGYDLGTVAYTLGEATELSYAILLPAAGYVAMVVTNGVDRDSWDNMSQAEQGAVAVGLGSLVLFVVSPDIASAVETSMLGQAGFVIVHVLAAGVLASE